MAIKFTELFLGRRTPYHFHPDGVPMGGGGGGRRSPLLSAREITAAVELLKCVRTRGGWMDAQELLQSGYIRLPELNPKIALHIGYRHEVTPEGLLLLDRYFEQEKLLGTKASQLFEVGAQILERDLVRVSSRLNPLFREMVRFGQALGNTYRAVEVFKEIRTNHPDLLPRLTEALVDFVPNNSDINKYSALKELCRYLLNNYHSVVPSDLKIFQSFVRLSAKLNGNRELARRMKKDAAFADLSPQLAQALIKHPEFVKIGQLCQDARDIQTFKKLLGDSRQLLAAEQNRENKLQLIGKLADLLEAGLGNPERSSAAAEQLQDPGLVIPRETRDKLINALRDQIKSLGGKMADQKLIEKLDNDPGFLNLVPALFTLIAQNVLFIKVAHLCQNLTDVATFERLMKDPLAAFKAETDPARVNDLIGRLILLVENQVIGREALIQLVKGNGSALPRDLNHRLAQLMLSAKDLNRLNFLLKNGDQPSAIPARLEELGQEMAGLAHKALEITRGTSSLTQKPALNIYILSTAHGFNGERILDAFYQEASARQRMVQKLAADRAELEALDSVGRVEEEMRLIHRAFAKLVEEKKKNEGLDRLTAVMQAAEMWIKSGDLPYFTYPLEIKIPSGSAASAEVKVQLEDLARKAQEYGWDINFIDHSTVRTADVAHHGDPVNFERGRAIARAMEIMEQALGGKVNRNWIYKENNWQLPIAPANYMVNLNGINLYAGKVYDQHVWGRKEEWVKIDDHGRTIMGVEAGKDGGKSTDTLIFPVLNGDGYYKLSSVASLFWKAFRTELARLEDWPPTAPSFRYSNLLFVCNANHHRSTTMEILTKELMRFELGPDAEKVFISSAGLDVEGFLRSHPDKQDMSARAKQMLIDQGISVDSLSKTQLTQEQIALADLILVMTEREKLALLNKFPQARSKVRVVREFLGSPQAEIDLPTPRNFGPEEFEVFRSLAHGIIDKITS